MRRCHDGWRIWYRDGFLRVAHRKYGEAAISTEATLVTGQSTPDMLHELARKIEEMTVMGKRQEGRPV